MEKKSKILVVDDDETMAEFVAIKLRSEGYVVNTEFEAKAAVEQLQSGVFDVLITDLGMPGMSGFELCEQALAIDARMPVIVVTGNCELEAAIRAMRAGAHDFLTKPIDTDTLTLRLRKACDYAHLSHEVESLRRQVSKSTAPAGMLGSSRGMRRTYDLLARAGQSDASVLVLGESGTGKELAARALHEASARKGRPFVAINCAAVPPNLLESELFGHVKGAFTDAKTARRGMFCEADGGTLFLDEVGELPIELQPKLLRVLQERTIRPVGASSETQVDVRIVAATNVDLEAQVDAGDFREDLLYRLDVIRVEMPPLRQRGRDVLVLAQHFLDQFGPQSPAKPDKISPDAAAKLQAYDWPGNVRELENCMQRSAALAQRAEIFVDDLPDKVKRYRSEQVDMSFEDPEDLVTLDELQARYIRRVLAAVGGNKSRAARVLGLDRRSLYRRLEKYET